MKVLFAVNNDDISDAIVKKYQKEYKEILSHKNVYYFNAILKELQKDNTYDRIIISEDLEPFANNNYDVIDKFIFEKLDNISDEGTSINGIDNEIILICTDRRSKSDKILVKFFGIGIYNAVIGQDRTTDTICRLIKNPRTKKEAKLYYRIESDSVNYQLESEENVSEAEIQNILAHYKRLGKNEDKYIESFNDIVSQYTDKQLKIIVRYLPISVKAVLESRSPKYQELVTFSNTSYNQKQVKQKDRRTNERNNKSEEEKLKIKMLDGKEKITKPIVIPSKLNVTNVKKLIDEEPDIFEELNSENGQENREQNVQENSQEKRGRGRPRKIKDESQDVKPQEKRGRGRPRKTENQDPIDLFNLDEEQKETDEEDIDLFNLDEEKNDKVEQEIEKEPIDLFSLEDDSVEESKTENTQIQNTNNYINNNSSFETLLTKDKKVVAFVGTTKNGTSFIVNNLAETLSSMGISTAILDMSTNKNAYYIYTKNEENLREVAKNSIYKLKSNVTEGIRVNKNLDVYTDLPNEERDYSDATNILQALVGNYSVVLIDCDFNTPLEYFAKAQEIYLVQSMDVLTIQPLTAFLRNLKSKNVLKEDRLRVIINKEQKLKSLPNKVLIGGLAFYNDPAMSFMTELFNKDKVKYCTVPFEMQNYIKYLDALVNCNISLGGYTKNLTMSLRELAGMVYPMLSRQSYSPRGDKYKDNFSTEMNSTLNKMKNNYNK